MSTDLRNPKHSHESESPKKDPEEILRDEIHEGRDAAERSSSSLFLSGLSAGLDIGFGLFLAAVALTTMNGAVAQTPAALLVAAMTGVGFVFVVLGRSELFTEQTTLAILPVLSGKATLSSLARVWAVVYVANLVGAAGFAALAVTIGPSLGVIDPKMFGEISSPLIAHPGWVIVLSGLLAGWLMGLLSWLVTASRDTISQILLTWIVAMVISFCHLHHVVLGSVEVLASAFAGQGVSAADFGHFLLWTTIGNALGGPLFVAIIKYGHSIGAQPPRHGVATDSGPGSIG